MTLSIWPHDTALEPDLPLRPFGHLTCFVASPFQPKNRFDDLFELVKRVCLQLQAHLQLDGFECVRSDSIASAGVIHPEIWQHLKRADVIVADVSGQNGNVLLELGVASAWRRKEQVIILREESADERHLFDINPARHIEYTRTSAGFVLLQQRLAAVMLACLIHIFEDNKGLLCYKHVVKTMFAATKEASECLKIAQHSVCCSQEFFASLS